MDDLNDQVRQRLKKVDALRAHGIDPFGGHGVLSEAVWQSVFEAGAPRATAEAVLTQHGARSAEELEQAKPTVSLAGRIMSLRRFGRASFAHLQDGTGRLQVYFKKESLGKDGFWLFERLDLGDLIDVHGHLFRTKTNELTLLVEGLALLCKAFRPLPEKWHGLKDVERRYRERELDLLTNPAVKNVFVQRSRIIQSLRGFLDKKGFIEVETPMMQPLPGGAAARPFVTHHHALNRDLYLRVAPELYLKRLIVGGFERVYELNRNFRNEGISTVHNPEFTMLEFYLAYADYQDLMTLTEELIRGVAEQASGTLMLTYQGEQIDLRGDWKRLPFHEAIVSTTHLRPDVLKDAETLRAQARAWGLTVKDDDPPGVVLLAIFEAKVEPTLRQPTFITDYPVEVSPLARQIHRDPTLVERFELFIAGLEVANAFSELNDPVDQRRRFEAQQARRQVGDVEAHPIDEAFLRALEHGMPPTAGSGIGVDRLVMLLTDQASIRDVILFPQLRPEDR